MKNKEKDFDEDILLDEKAFNKRFRQVSEEELPEPIRKRREAARRKLKSRLTIYFDSDIVSSFKKMGEREGVGYQTLMNNALRKLVDGLAGENEKSDLKEDILRDKKFLKRLKTALSA